jgi:hypothetical protein
MQILVGGQWMMERRFRNLTAVNAVARNVKQANHAK